ncbi:organic hydroperoxide resistance protein [Siculibacillus lacustris]|uniref:Organic hydroperoxide resistance protein n=1 Tax=Siculibacillus lacustris TaxID=1549641 RepID=A0A4Q9VUE1_9HYPH|nr:organic hydroperoxide resistance protein [Siculibacillus lacustris]TBW39792.1 organic hydroperoxide resistance protein [Siculibacillus lacustris]
MQILYTATATSTGGRDGRTRSDDGLLDIALAMPPALGGNGAGTNPEQLFAAGFSACFLSALKLVAGQGGVALPKETAITGRVSIGKSDDGFGLAVSLTATAPGIDTAVLQDLIAKAHQVCPYSKATRGNIEVALAVA